MKDLNGFNFVVNSFWYSEKHIKTLPPDLRTLCEPFMKISEDEDFSITMARMISDTDQKEEELFRLSLKNSMLTLKTILTTDEINPIIAINDTCTNEIRHFNESGDRLTFNEEEIAHINKLPAFGNIFYPDSDIDSYHKHPELFQFLNRKIWVVDSTIESLRAKVEELFDQGYEKLFLKSMDRAKAGTCAISKENAEEILVQLEFHPYDLNDFQLGGKKDSLLIQEFAKIEYEMRVYVKNGKIVTSAGYIWGATPEDNEAVFDPKVQKARESLSDGFERNPRLVGELIDFAQEVLDFIYNQENPIFQDRDMALDVAIINGKPGVVEFNTFVNAGLFACDLERLIAASWKS